LCEAGRNESNFAGMIGSLAAPERDDSQFRIGRTTYL
jgi:hypothetical protein